MYASYCRKHSSIRSAYTFVRPKANVRLNTVSKMNSICNVIMSLRFFLHNLNLTGFPNFLGCIDGTFIRIQKPSENEADYVNRKGYHALSVQVCFVFLKYFKQLLSMYYNMPS